jgi:hypothetical protein
MADHWRITAWLEVRVLPCIGARFAIWAPSGIAQFSEPIAETGRGRKATARRLAEIGCTANQIAAITGHASLSEAQRYTKAADRKRMAREAMAKLIEGGW